MPNIKLRDGSGVETTYNNVDTITVPLADGSGTVIYGADDSLYPSLVDNEYWGQNCMPYLKSLDALSVLPNHPIRRGDYMFAYADVPSGLEIECDVSTSKSLMANYLFYKAKNIQGFPIFHNLYLHTGSTHMFTDCEVPGGTIQPFLNQIQKLCGEDFYSKEGVGSAGRSFNLQNIVANSNVESVDFSVLQDKMSSIDDGYSSFNSQVSYDYCLKSVVFPVVSSMSSTSNKLGHMGTLLLMLGSVKFATNNGVPYVAGWSNQTLDLSSTSMNAIGCMTDNYSVDDGTKWYSYIDIFDNDFDVMVLKYNEVKDTNQRWYARGNATKTITVDGTNYTIKVSRGFSHYDHDSAVDTINSLPDTSAAVSQTGKVNTIKFHPASGYFTDAGACYSLTAEEIAVAVDKGWTVAFSSWTN